MTTESLSDACACDICSFFCFCSSTHTKASKSILTIEPRFTTIPARSVIVRERNCSLHVRPLFCKQVLAKGVVSFPEAGCHQFGAAGHMQHQQHHPHGRRLEHRTVSFHHLVLLVANLVLGLVGMPHWAS